MSEPIDRILEDFRSWWESAGALAEEPDDPCADLPAIDAASLLQQFIALKQEIHLQTRASRSQIDQNGQALELLRSTVQERKDRSSAPANDDVCRPLLKALIETHDSLALARREVQKSAAQAQAILDCNRTDSAARENVPIPWYARWLGLQATVDRAVVEKRRSEEPPDRALKMLQALAVGYGMSLERLERTLQQQGLEAIEAVGAPFDPEAMEVLELVVDTDRPSGEVVDEIRRGYMWQGRVFRFAQVRVAKGNSPASRAP